MFNIKKDFPWFKNNPKLVYIDSAATSLKPQCVVNTIVDFYTKWTANPHNTDSKFTYNTHLKIEEVRNKLAKLINASNANEVVFTSGATESLCLIANGLKPYVKANDEIILTYGEHTSNTLPWFELCEQNKSKIVFAGTKEKFPTEKDIIKAITSKTKIISFADGSNLLGYQLNIKKIVTEAKKINKNIIVVCDATQSMPHKKHDVTKDGLDFLVCSGHKMCAGTGIGMAYIKSEYLNKIKPIRFGGGMNNNVYIDHYTFASAPDKFEGGSPHVAGILSWGTAIDYLNKLGWNNIANHEYELKQYINEQFAKLNNVVVYNYQSKLPLIAFNIKDIHAQDVANYLGNKGIIVRSGTSCAKLSPFIFGDYGLVRASFYIYSDKKDVDKLVNIIKTINKESVLKYVIR